MIYYHGYPIGSNLGDDACFLSFVFSIKHKYRKLITLIPSDKCKIAILGGGSLITNQLQCGFTEFSKIVKRYKLKAFVFGTGYDYFEGCKTDWLPTVKDVFLEENCFWRGPITLEAMGGYGVVSGDPALNENLLLSRIKYSEYGNFEIGLSYGESVGKYSSEFFRDNFSNIDPEKIVLLPVCVEDSVIMKRDFSKSFCMERIGWADYVGFIKDHVCHMHSMKLHSTIAAFLSKKEYTSYDYRLKCEDFEKSKNMISLDIMIEKLNKEIEKKIIKGRV